MSQKIKKAIEVFRGGGVVVFPTDTAIGIGCRMDDEESVKRIFEIKKRDYNDPLMVLVDSVEMANQYVLVPVDVREKLIKKYWPGGLTILFNCNLEKVPSIVRSGTKTLAVRFPAHEEIRELIKKVGVPLIATSANISGGETPYSISEVNKEFISKVDFVLEGECTYKKESTIIDCTVSPWKIIREGAVRIKKQELAIKNCTLYLDTSDNKKIIVGIEIDGEKFFEEKKTLSKEQIILQMIDEVLNKHSLALKDLAEIHVNTGPGSYTGLRVGIAIANALSFALQIPINGKPPGDKVFPIYS